MADHDHSYKLLFSQPEAVAHLLSHLKRREKWIAELDLATLQPAPAHRLSDDLRERENDIVWRVKWQGRRLYLMIEFQSCEDKWMAVRDAGRGSNGEKTPCELCVPSALAAVSALLIPCYTQAE